MLDHEISDLADKKNSLAIVIARGASVRAWARANGLSEQTASQWSSEREGRGSVNRSRRNAVGRSVGRMRGCSGKAVKAIEKLAAMADYGPARIAALPVMPADAAALAKFSLLEPRMTELEEWRDSLMGVTFTGRFIPERGKAGLSRG